ncbi:MAG TPA: xanthine dehydrogenase family protein subunit M [Deltaproteobacteria bacterium]|nr:xanthine dehydrogenase family protein subunit M [Deltaproteobacteria bacterium]HQM71623.1 xanthine dehydrogenase family protein subunit M [Deltaproteobacteria bacterium]
MKPFRHFNAHSVDEAASLMAGYDGKACIMAGGTDLLVKMKDRILPSYPEALVNIKTIPGLDAIREEGGVLRIGALARLSSVAAHPVVLSKYRALAEAAGRTASPQLRNMGTIGGNLCQDIRCWYYRGPGNRFSCLRKGGGRCYALKGDNRFHSIFGGSVEKGCVAVHPSDTAPALIALGASVVTSRRTINAEQFFNVRLNGTTVLEPGEIVTEIRIPEPPEGTRSAFLKFALRKAIDFPIVNCAASLAFDHEQVASARICLNAVHVVPRRVTGAEQMLQGRIIADGVAGEAAEAAVQDARPLEHNAYMVQVARTLVKRSILACGG